MAGSSEDFVPNVPHETGQVEWEVRRKLALEAAQAAPKLGDAGGEAGLIGGTEEERRANLDKQVPGAVRDVKKKLN